MLLKALKAWEFRGLTTLNDKMVSFYHTHKVELTVYFGAGDTKFSHIAGRQLKKVSIVLKIETSV